MFRTTVPSVLPASIDTGSVALLAACGDSHPPVQAQVFSAIARAHPDAVLFTGDASLAGDSDRARRTSLRRWRRDWGGVADRVYPVPGNHDIESPGWRATWSDAVPRAEWSPLGYEHLAFAVEVGPAVVVGLAALPPEGIGDVQREWALQAFEASRAPNRIAVFHEPAWPCGARVGDSLDRDPATRDRLWRSLEDSGVGLVINGHEHGYSRRTVTVRRPVVQVVTGGAGARLYLVDTGEADFQEPAFNYVLISASAEGLRCRALTPDGRAIDEFEVLPHAPER